MKKIALDLHLVRKKKNRNAKAPFALDELTPIHLLTKKNVQPHEYDIAGCGAFSRNMEQTTMQKRQCRTHKEQADGAIFSPAISALI